jgi:hypothetical protein
MRYSSPLSVLRRLGLRLGSRGHEGYQRVPYGLLNGVRRLAVELEAIDDRLDDDALLHEGPDSLRHVIVIAPQAVQPTHHQDVATAQDIEQAMALRTLNEPCGDA